MSCGDETLIFVVARRESKSFSIRFSGSLFANPHRICAVMARGIPHCVRNNRRNEQESFREREDERKGNCVETSEI